MADLSRFLPLSQRRREPEDGVSSDRRAEVAAIVRSTAVLLEGVARADELARQFFADAGIPGVGPDAASFDEAAEAVGAGERCSIRVLASVVRAHLVVARALGVEPDLSATASGTVVLYLVTGGPFDRRAVFKGNTLRATDAEWEFGHGPARLGTAKEFLEFLLALSDVPPPVVPTRR